jgi:hypothetical protein
MFKLAMRAGTASFVLGLCAACSGMDGNYEADGTLDERAEQEGATEDGRIGEVQQEILNGAPVAADSTRYRSVAHLMFSFGGVTSECGGTLVASDWVASAAHCFVASAEAKALGLTDAHFKNPANWTLSLNRYDATTTSGEQHTLSQIILHPTFSNVQSGIRPFTGLDVAVVQLTSASGQKPLRLMGEAQLAPIDEGGIDAPDAGLGQRVTGVGWGMTAGGNTDQLQEATLALAGTGSECFDLGQLAGQVAANETCVGWYLWFAGLCQGDSGGPLLMPVAGVDQVVGIASWRKQIPGIGCSSLSGPGVMTRSADSASWVESTISGNFYLSSGGKAGWSTLTSSTLGRSRLRVGDFNGNGRDDLLYHTGGKWYVKWSGTGNWLQLATDAAAVGSMLIGDFDGDDKSDVLVTTGSQWDLRSGGSAARVKRATSATVASQLLVGDFDGNGADDVLYASGVNWRVKYAGTGAWHTVLTNTTTPSSMLVADVNGDSADDIVITTGSKWQVSYGASAAPVTLVNTATVASELVVGDFDGNGRDDILYADGSSFRVKNNGAGNWVRFQYTGGTASTLLVGRFNSTLGADVLQTVR